MIPQMTHKYVFLYFNIYGCILKKNNVYVGIGIWEFWFTYKCHVLFLVELHAVIPMSLEEAKVLAKHVELNLLPTYSSRMNIMMVLLSTM